MAITHTTSGCETSVVMWTTPGLAGVLEHDWQKAAMFYARFGATESMFRRGVPLEEPQSGKGCK